MNQVEIAKKILEQGNCRGIYCDEGDLGCPFNVEYGTPCTVHKWRNLTKVKQWLKEREGMIDLNVDQIVDPPVKCWVKDSYETESMWRPRWLVAIVDKKYYSIESLRHCDDITFLDAFRHGRCAWKQCSLTDPTIPTKKIKKWLTVEDVPPELFGKALCKHKNEHVWQSVMLTPYKVTNTDGTVIRNLVYLPLGQPLTGKWLPFESEE